MFRSLLLPASALLIAFSPAGAVPIEATGALGALEGDLTYNATSATAATLTLSVSNTSPAANGGFLTAFVFNNPSDLITGATLTSAPANFTLLSSPNNINGAPNGQFDFVVTTNPNPNVNNAFEGGGNPNRGIAVGSTGTFVLSFTGTALDTLDEADFLSALSQGTGSGDGFQAFSFRFRGFEDGGSDKVTPPDDSTITAPAPAALGLFGLGLIGVALRRRA